MRPKETASTAVNETQAADLTLTMAPVAEHTLQTWVRTAASVDKSGKVLTAEVSAREGALLQAGQRARAFQVSSRSSMYQAQVTRVTSQGDRFNVEAGLTAIAPVNGADFVLEIVVDRGRFLAVPNAAIIEEGDRRIVYVQRHPGHYVPTEIHTGLQGELHTQVLHGLEAGDEIVTFGSFFVDAEYKLKAGGTDSAMSHEHQHH